MEWLLDPGVTHLNHGSYGACPRPVVDAWQEWQRQLESSPTDVLHQCQHVDTGGFSYMQAVR